MRSKNTKFHFDNLYFTQPVQYGAVNLIQIGDLCSKEGFEVEEHVQPCHEISYIVSGKGVFKGRSNAYQVKSGDIFFSPKGDSHYIKSSNHAPLRYFYFGFNFAKDSAEYKYFADIDFLLSRIGNPLIADRFNVYNIFNNAFNEIRQNFEKKDIVIKSCLEQMILYTFKNYYYKSSNVIINENDNRRKNEIVYDIVNYIDNNIVNIKRLTDISDYIGYSYSYTSQIFSNSMGMSLGYYYQKIRLEKALELIQNNTSITQTAEILGFDSVHSFSRTFKKHFESSPKNFLQKSI